ncbi:MAG: type II secretion system F family protein [Zoogloeaceae bacterium]|jgi:type IV pilus assembly protein PilC|nr:type II secretion system F family protein [Zoogloeaceae bacterium]
MATQARSKAAVKEYTFVWKGKNKEGRIVSGEIRAATEMVVQSQLRRQGILSPKITRLRMKSGKKISEKDITVFTRQLATMMRAGVPLLQAFDIVGRGHANPSVGKLLMDIKSDIETGSSLSVAFRKYPRYFDTLFINLVGAGEQAGILDSLLERLASYKEKIQSIKGKIKSALFYPAAVIVITFILVAAIMTWVVPAFKEMFSNFGGELPYPTQIVIGISDTFVEYWYVIFGVIFGGVYAFVTALRTSEKLQNQMDRLMLNLPLFGELVRKSVIARWSRTLSTMFEAGVPLVEALESVGGAAGNDVYKRATREIQLSVSTGTSLTASLQQTDIFPNMVVQMVAIGEESGSLATMLGKVADFFEEEVDQMVEALSSLMEPIIMVVLGVVIGGIIIAMYLPIFKMGSMV